jgi:ribosomal protein S18 acetylase RimI-like enzyme
MSVRRLEKGKLEPALDLIWTVFQEFEAPDYSEDGVSYFKAFIEPENIAEMVGRGELAFWGVEADGRLAGVIASKGKDHICMLFVRREFQRRGIARRLLEAMIGDMGLGEGGRITVNSSPYAVEVYRRLGFSPIDGEREENGIRYTPMVREV